MKLVRVVALLLALSLLLGGCSLFGEKEDSSSAQESPSEQEEKNSEYPVEAGGIVLDARPGKVVSLTPALTEKLFDLGMDDRLVGVSDYCDYPGEVAALSPCGTAQMPDLDAIEQLEPHLVISAVELPGQAMEWLDEQGIPVAVFPHVETVDELLALYVDLARLMEGETSGQLIGESVAEEFQRRLSDLSAALEDYTGGAAGRKSVLYLRLLDFTVATGDTFENELLQMLCMDNIASGYSDWLYPEEDAKSADGQVAFAGIDVIIMDEEFVTIKDLERSAFYKGLPATIQDRYVYISSIIMERQSLRTLDLLAELAAAVYPDADVRVPGNRNSRREDVDLDEPGGEAEESSDANG